MGVVCKRGVALAGFLAACSSSPHDEHRPFPEVPTLDGAILSPLHLVTIVPQNDAMDTTELFAFSDALGGSQWWLRAAPEYGLGALVADEDLVGPPITTNVTDHDLFKYVDTFVAANSAIARDGRTVYLLYLPPTIVVDRRGELNTNCHLFGAYHVAYGARGDNLAFVQRCTETFPIENMTIAASHEIFESATDPDGRGYVLPGVAARKPWTETIWNAVGDASGAELGDLCEGTFWREGTHLFQRMWSNAAARRGGDPCVPALAEPFYDTDFDQDWYAVPAGSSVTIPVTGWATGSISGWPVSAFIGDEKSPFKPTLPGAATLAPGARVDLTVTAAAGTTSGTFAVIHVDSHRPRAAPGSRSLTDGGHVNFVGVYVP